MDPSYYDAEYYRIGFGEHAYERKEPWLSFFGNIAHHIKHDFSPKTVMDAGCAIGLLVEQLAKRGIKAQGVDISEYAIREAKAAGCDCYQGSLVDPFPATYDFIVCIETLEHMPEDEARTAVRNMCAASDSILFSSTSDDFEEPSHVNVQPQAYWIDLFRENGFRHEEGYNAGYICPWAKLFWRQSG